MTGSVPRPPYGAQEAFASHGVNRAHLIVLHDTEGGSPSSVARTLRGDSPPLGIHWIVGESGSVARGLDSNYVAWHCSAYNDEAIGIEQCGFASYRRSRWMQNRWQLLNVAWIVAWESRRHGIPLMLLDASDVFQSGARGVTTHSALGTVGGGHHDPGPGYPLDHVVGMARSIQERGLGKLERARATIHAHGRLG